MAGTLQYDIHQSTDGTRTFGNCTAWAKLSVPGGVPAIDDSLNVASVTDNGVGDFAINFDTVMDNVNYAFSGAVEGTVTQSVVTVQRDANTTASKGTSLLGYTVKSSSPGQESELDLPHSIIVFGGIN